MSIRSKQKRSLFQWVVRILTGYEITVISILLLIAIVFFSTLEQAEVGLYTVKQRYYSIDVFLVQPELRGKLLPIVLPGAYWVCAIFTLNLICGGVLKMAALFAFKNRSTMPFVKRFGKFIGVFTSHISMAVLMIAGAVDYHKSTLTMLSVKEGETNHIGSSEENIVIEVSEIENGVTKNVHIISNEMIQDMILNGKVATFSTRPDSRIFSFESFPFTVEFNGWYRNSDIFPAKSKRDEDPGAVVNGAFIREDDILTQAESQRIGSFNEMVSDSKRQKIYNLGSAYLKIVSLEGEITPMIVSDAFRLPSTVNVGGKTYGFKMTRRNTVLPFEISLKELDVDTYQGTSMAREYTSYIEYENNGEAIAASISMNKPFRHSGYTVYQARWSANGINLEDRKKFVEKQREAGLPLDFPDHLKLESIYQVVSNPADKWPEYCVYVSGVALLLHFMLKLSAFVWNSFNRKKVNEV